MKLTDATRFGFLSAGSGVASYASRYTYRLCAFLNTCVMLGISFLLSSIRGFDASIFLLLSADAIAAVTGCRWLAQITELTRRSSDFAVRSGIVNVVSN